MIRPFTRWNGFCFLQAGVAGLVLDCTLFLFALAAGFWSAPAAAIGYASGAVLQGLICNRGVFVNPTATVSQLRGRQQFLFTYAAAVGLAVTVFAVASLMALGTAPLVAKLAAVILSFATTLLIRRKMLLVA